MVLEKFRKILKNRHKPQWFDGFITGIEFVLIVMTLSSLVVEPLTFKKSYPFQGVEIYEPLEFGKDNETPSFEFVLLEYDANCITNFKLTRKDSGEYLSGVLCRNEVVRLGEWEIELIEAYPSLGKVTIQRYQLIRIEWYHLIIILVSIALLFDKNLWKDKKKAEGKKK